LTEDDIVTLMDRVPKKFAPALAKREAKMIEQQNFNRG